MLHTSDWSKWSMFGHLALGRDRWKDLHAMCTSCEHWSSIQVIHIYWNRKGKQRFDLILRSVVHDPWSLRGPLTVHSCQAASALRLASAPTLPLRPGIKIKPVSLTSGGLSVIHRDEHCSLPTQTQMAEHWPRDFATSSSFSWERLMSIMENPRRAS